jgi:iron(III) transport system substrate-binding protein
MYNSTVATKANSFHQTKLMIRAACRTCLLLGALFLTLTFLERDRHSVDAAEGKSLQREWEDALRLAKKEGEVVVYGNEEFGSVLSEFQQRYPEIKVSSVLSGAREFTQRLMTERRAGKYMRDVYINGATTGHQLYIGKALDPIKPALLLPEVVDQVKWWQEKHHYVDQEGRYLFTFGKTARLEVAFNTNLVNPKEIRSRWDILSPKWRGKILISDPRASFTGTALRFLYYHPELGPEYVRRLFGEMEPTASRDVRQMVDWLASGRFAILMLVPVTDRLGIFKAKEQGLPVGWFDSKHLSEGVSLSSATGNVGLINQAPHPNAAKVFINWLLTREGQMAYQKAYTTGSGADSLRIDIPKDDVHPDARRVERGKYFLTDNPEWEDMTSILKFIDEVWKRKN